MTYELASQLIGQECIIYPANAWGSNLVGVITDVKDGWVSVERAGTIEALNLDYISRMRVHPRNKNGKKAWVMD